MDISLISPKGGVGKTTTCGTLAYALAARGEKVDILELDPNGPLKRLSTKRPIPGIRVKTSSEPTFADDYDAAKKEGADHLFIDLAGVLHVGIFKAFFRSDLVVIPTGLSEPDLMEALKTVKHIKELSKDTGRTINYRLLLTRVPTLRSRNGDYISQQIKKAGLACLDTPMTERQAYKSLFTEGRAPHTINDATEAEVGNILREIIEAAMPGYQARMQVERARA